MEKVKGTWQTLIETIKDENGDGSSKRISMLWTMLFIITPMALVYSISFLLISIKSAGYRFFGDITEANLDKIINAHWSVCQQVINEFPDVFWSALVFFLVIAGICKISDIKDAITVIFTRQKPTQAPPADNGNPQQPQQFPYTQPKN